MLDIFQQYRNVQLPVNQTPVCLFMDDVAFLLGVGANVRLLVKIESALKVVRVTANMTCTATSKVRGTALSV